MSDTEAVEPREALTFDWGRRMPIGASLLLFVGLSALLHLGAFYFFQVVYPPSRRSLPQEATFTILAPRDAASRSVLGRIEDRVAGLGLSPIPDPLDEERFQMKLLPAFLDYEAQLAADPRVFPPIAPPSLLLGESPLLGHLEEVPPPPPVGEPYEFRPYVELGGAIGDRALHSNLKWEDAQALFAATDASEAVFIVAVTPLGRVKYCLQTGNSESDLDGQLLSKVREMRFDTVEADADSSGEVRLRW